MLFPMSVALKPRPASLADLLAIPEPERFHELIGGEIVQKAMPSPKHGSSQANLTGRLVGPYGRRPGGRSPGGWRFMTETEIRFTDDDVYRPDIAGFRRENLPVIPNETPLGVRPDWVCEIISPSNERNDIIKKMLTYQRCGVPHYWLIDPILEALVVYRWTDAGYLLVQSAQREERIRAEPFDAVMFSVRGLLEGDEEEDEG
jgi:Uma2 family endonuclease